MIADSWVMDPATSYVALTNAFLEWSAMSHAMGHIHAGLAIYLGVQLVLRTGRASAIALQAVIGAELVNEIIQRAYYGSWRWADTSADIALTIAWPTALYLLASYRRQRWTRWQARARQHEATGPAPLQDLSATQR